MGTIGTARVLRLVVAALLLTALSLVAPPPLHSVAAAPAAVSSYGRPPYGNYDFTVRDAFAAKSMRMWLWDVDTNDWRGNTQSQVVSYVVTSAHSRDTVLMHMGWNAFTPGAMSAMQAGLARKGLGVCRNPGTTTPTYPRTIGC